MLVVGSIGYDTIYGPVASGASLLGGSATYCSIAASHLTHVSVLAVVGEDFRSQDFDTFINHDIDIDGIAVKKGEKTFAWTVQYDDHDINSRETIETQLNALASFDPQINAQHQKEEILFLANMAPALQIQVINDMDVRPRWIGLDTMNFWIDSDIDTLTKAIKMVDIVFMDEGEIRSYSQSTNVLVAASKILNLGPSLVVAKRGENGVILINEDWAFTAPAFPVKTVVDPTGAGDSFAGGFMGFLDVNRVISPRILKRGIIAGSIMGSHAVEALSIEAISSITYEKFIERFEAFSILTQFDPLDKHERFPWKR